MKVREIPTQEVRPYTDNPRVISERAVRAVADSIHNFGFRQPLIVDSSGVLVAGHVRLEAAKMLGIKRVPVHVADLTADQIRAYRIADNRTGELSLWDETRLTSELQSLVQSLDADNSRLSELSGLDEDYISDLLREPDSLSEILTEEVLAGPDSPIEATEGDIPNLDPPDPTQDVTEPPDNRDWETVEQRRGGRNQVACPQCGEILDA